MDDNKDSREVVYEIGYLLIGSIPEEQVTDEAEKIKKSVTKTGASVISDEMAHKLKLAYTMRKKTVSGSYDKYDEAYFGWVKFECVTDKIAEIKKSLDENLSVLRFLITTTVRENTYLGKRAAAMMAKAPLEAADREEKKEAPVVATATIEEMDKSIDEMVKEAI